MVTTAMKRHIWGGTMVLGLAITIVAGAACAMRTTAAADFSGRKGASLATVAGVRIVAAVDEWRDAAGRDTAIVPVLLTIDNDSDRPLQVRYRELMLVTPSAEALPPLSPFDPDAPTDTLPASYAHQWYGFHLAPHLHAVFRGFWSGWPFAADDAYHRKRYRQFAASVDATPEMIRRALPEGVLEPDGSITGVLYFPAPHLAAGAALVATLIDAESRAAFARLEVPISFEENGESRAETVPETGNARGMRRVEALARHRQHRARAATP